MKEWCRKVQPVLQRLNQLVTATETIAGIRVILSRLKNIKVIMTVRVTCNLLVLRAVMFIQKSPKDANDGRLGERTSLNDIESVLQRPDWLAVAATVSATETLEVGYCLVKNIRDYYVGERGP